jgi:glycosyltransferase involved in cell wall biosynthesis
LGIADTATVFVAFGHVTPEKRIAPVLGGLAGLVAHGHDAHLLLVGQAAGMPSLQALIDGHGGRVHPIGYVPDDQIAACFAAADACVSLRWPTAGETSASWLRALAAGTPTVITALAHLTDVPTIDAATGRRSHPSKAPVAVSVDLLDEENAVRAAMARLSADAQLRSDLASAGHAYWAREHRLELMADDYRRAVQDAAARPAPAAPGLPSHFTDDYSALVRRIEEEMGVDARIRR